MIIEFRNSSGSAAFKATLNGEQVSLRSLGCPDWLARKVDESRANRKNSTVHVPVQQSPEVEALREKFNSVSLF
jgi:hypothetical protein